MDMLEKISILYRDLFKYCLRYTTIPFQKNKIYFRTNMNVGKVYVTMQRVPRLWTWIWNSEKSMKEALQMTALVKKNIETNFVKLYLNLFENVAFTNSIQRSIIWDFNFSSSVSKLKERNILKKVFRPIFEWMICARIQPFNSVWCEVYMSYLVT